MKCFLWILLLIKVPCSAAQAPEFSEEYDMTKAINDTIVGIFRTIEQRNLNNIIDLMVHYDHVTHIARTPYTYKINTKISNYTAAFTHPNIINAYADNLRVSYDFLTQKLKFHYDQLVVQFTGTLRIYSSRYTFESVLRFKNCTIFLNGLGIYEAAYLQYHHLDIETKGRTLEILRRSDWPDLDKNFERVLPNVIWYHMNRNRQLLNTLKECHGRLSTPHIPSCHPHFKYHQRLHYYRIQNISVESFNLRNIFIRGMSNFHWLNFTANTDWVVHTLFVYNALTKMTLEDIMPGRSVPVTLELRNSIPELYISDDKKINRVRVEAKSYSCLQTNFNTSLSTYQTKVIMDLVERAIELSISPSIKSIEDGKIKKRNIELEKTIRQIMIQHSEPFDEETSTKQPHNNSIPFDGNATETNSVPRNEQTTLDIYNYHITFPEITINLVSANPQYSDQLQCISQTNSTFIHRINVTTGKNNSSNNSVPAIDLKFNFIYPSVNVSLIKPNHSIGNDSCEFRIRNDRDIELELPPPTTPTCATESNGQLEMKKKIDSTLLSMLKDRIVRTVKPIVCLPFDVCIQTANMVDEFFNEFVDIVVKKCSLRKNTPAQDQQFTENFFPRV